MSFGKRKRLLGFLVLTLGVGILLVILVPTVGWIIFSALCLVGAGVYLLKC